MTEFIESNASSNTSTKYFTKAFTTFNEELSLPKNCLPFPGAKFGLLNLQAITSEPSTVEHELILVIDNSGSMGDHCLGDNDKTQMDQAIHTLKNIIGYLEENQNIKANVTIFKFDDKFIKVVDRTNITEENYNSIEKSISKIRPNGGTDIGLALHETNKYITELKNLYPDHQISHIFMTDGEVTCGEYSPELLKPLVDKNIYNYFIGYGSNHDAKLLGILSDFEKGSYHYIDAIEKAGLVFGEILHGITHKLLYNCEIVVENGVIYNYKTNLYTNKLYIGNIIGESNKVYHLFTDNPTTCYVHLKTIVPSSMECLELHIFQETEHTLNFMNYVFRHKTLTLLGEVKQCQEKYEGSARFGNEGYFSYGNVSDCKMKMAKLFDEMRKYMEDNNDKQNKFIKMLCDDIHISQKTFGTRYGRMYISSRQSSQGTQRIYTVNTTPIDRVKVSVNMNSRSSSYVQKSASCYDSDDDGDDDGDDVDVQKAAPSREIAPEPDEYEVSNNCMDDSPYLTHTATSVMRSISYNSDEEKDNEEEDNDKDSLQ